VPFRHSFCLLAAKPLAARAGRNLPVLFRGVLYCSTAPTRPAACGAEGELRVLFCRSTRALGAAGLFYPSLEFIRFRCSLFSCAFQILPLFLLERMLSLWYDRHSAGGKLGSERLAERCSSPRVFSAGELQRLLTFWRAPRLLPGIFSTGGTFCRRNTERRRNFYKPGVKKRGLGVLPAG